MYREPQDLARAAIFLLFVHANLIVDIAALSKPRKSANSKTDSSLMSGNGHRNCQICSEASAEIDAAGLQFSPNVKSAHNRHLLKNELFPSGSELEVDQLKRKIAGQDGREKMDQLKRKIAGQDGREKMDRLKRKMAGQDGREKMDRLKRKMAGQDGREKMDQLKRKIAGQDGRVNDSQAPSLANANSNSRIACNETERIVAEEGQHELDGYSHVATGATFQEETDRAGGLAVTPVTVEHAGAHESRFSSLISTQTTRKAELNRNAQESHTLGEAGRNPLKYSSSDNQKISRSSSDWIDINRHAINSVDVSDGLSRHRRQSEAVATSGTTNNRNIRAREEGGAIIGALFPLHHAPSQKTAYSRQCGQIREHYGIQRVEMFILTIQKINRDPTILKDIKLGWDIRDSCWYSAIALENSIDFIKDAIASQSRSNSENSSFADAPTQTPPSSSSSPSMSWLPGTGREPPASCADTKNHKPIIGVVGPGSSESTIQVQNLLQIFNIPQIGYSATSMDLSDKSHYKYFLRVVPPDRFQAQALVDILLAFNWTYISTVHSDGNYGVRGMEKFLDLAKSRGVCVAVSDNVASTAEDSEFDGVLDNLLEAPNASVVVCFCEGNTVKNIFRATRRKNLEGRFLFIGSDGWGNRLDVVENLETAAAGGISIKLYSPAVNDFGPHYAKLKPTNSSKNPWMTEFWEWRFNCSMDKNNMKHYPRFCSGNESLADSLEDSKLGFVVNAVTTMARALHNMHQDLCPGHKGLCPAMEPLNGSVYLQYLLNVSFISYSGEDVHFDSQGDPPGRYEILNYQPVTQADGNVTYDYVTIGHWKTGSLNLTDQEVYWPRQRSAGQGEMIKSVCSEPCHWRQAKKVKGVACCWICTTCLDNEILVDNNTDCQPCDQGMWPNINKTGCEKIAVENIDWSDTQAIVCISLACLGISATIWVFAIFVRHHDTPIVKASTRELSYVILAGICLAFSASFFIVAKPSRPFCYLTRILPGLSFSLIYGALVTRTNRIARILEGSKRIMTKKPRFMSATAQVVITGIIICIECAVIAGMLVCEPANSRTHYPEPQRAMLVCDTSTTGIVVPLTFDLVLIILCTIYAVKTRNLPENFNEAKFIGFTMYSTCVIWLGFFPIYFAGDNKEITLSLSVSLSAASALLLLFIPKVYVILWIPEKNTRRAFTTSKDVRCHIGSKSMASGDSVDIKDSSTFDSLFKVEKGHARYWKQKSLDEKRLRFVMQRAGGSDGDTPYVNHGVLAKHLRSAFMDRDSKDSCKTDSTPVSSFSCPEKERFISMDSREMTNAETIRQNLARDYLAQKRQVSLRPGSPAEREKHRIHSFNHIVDLDMVLGLAVVDRHGRPRKRRDFKKSLSSSCVSTCAKTKSVKCQTSEDLVLGLLPALRKRCISRGKNKLERTGAVDDGVLPVADISKEVHVYRNPVTCQTSSPSWQRSSAHCDNHSSSDLSPLVICHNCEDEEFTFPSHMNSHKSPSSLYFSHNENAHRRHSYNIPYSNHFHHDLDCHRRCSNDPCQVFLPSSDETLHIVKPEVITPNDTSDFRFLEGMDNLEDIVTPAPRSPGIFSFSRQLPVSMPEPGMSPSSHSVRDCLGFLDLHAASYSSQACQESRCSSATMSTSSSSFTLPPFQTSTESNLSQSTFAESDDVIEIEESNNNSNNNPGEETKAVGDDADDGDEELTKILQHRTSASKVDNLLKPKRADTEVPVVPLEDAPAGDDVLEFQKYLQGHGVRLDLSTARSSDL